MRGLRCWRRMRMERLGWRAAAGLAGLVVLAGGVTLDRRIGAAEAANRALAAQQRRWEAPAREAGLVRGEIEALGRRGNAIDTLLRVRERPPQLLAALSARVPHDVYLRAVSLLDDTVTLEGAARSNERVSALLRELDVSPSPVHAELIESRAEPGTGFAFSIRLLYRAAASPAGAPAPPPRDRSGHGAG